MTSWEERCELFESYDIPVSRSKIEKYLPDVESMSHDLCSLGAWKGFASSEGRGGGRKDVKRMYHQRDMYLWIIVMLCRCNLPNDVDKFVSFSRHSSPWFARLRQNRHDLGRRVTCWMRLDYFWWVPFLFPWVSRFLISEFTVCAIQVQF